MSSEQQPVKRKRIVPTPVAPLESGASVLHATSSGQVSAPQQAPVDLYQGPFTLPGRRMEADISRHYVINYIELLKKTGVDPKQLKARQASSAAEKAGKLPAGLPNLPGLPRAGASPSAGGKLMFGLVVDRLQRIYTSAPCGDGDGENEEGEYAAGTSDDSGSHSSDSSGDLSNESDDSDDGSSEHSSEEPPQPEPDDGGRMRGPGVPPTSGTEGAAAGPPAAVTAGATSDGVSASSKKLKQRRRPVEAYEADFIDDDEEIRYAKSRGAKTKYDGFFINQGAVELEKDPEAEEEQRQAQKRGSRPRSQPAAQPAKAKPQQPAQGLQTGGGASTAAALAAPAAGATAGTGDAVGGGALTPVRKRKVEGNQPQPAGKKRKQVQPDLAAVGPRSPGPAATSTAAQPAAPVLGAHQGLAALAAALGRSAGATAASLGEAAAAAAPAGAMTGALASNQVATTAAERSQGGASSQQPAEAAAEPASAIAGTLFARVSGRRHVANPASLEPVINDCRKKLAAVSTPPSDWAALVKLLDTPLTQIALFLHRNHRGDPQGYEAGVALVARALAEVAPTAVDKPSAIVELLQDAIQRRLVKSNNDLSKMVAAVKKLAGEVAAANAGAPMSGSGGGTGGAHSSDDEFTEPAGGSTASALLEALETKLRSYLNLHRKLHNSEDESTTVQSLAAQAGVGIDMLQRALLSAHSRPAGQRKRQGSKTAASGADDTLKQQAAMIAAMVAAEVDRDIGASAPTAGPAGTIPGVAPATAQLSQPTSSALAAGPSTVDTMEVGTEVFPGTSGSQPEAHQFPTIEEDHQQRKQCRAALKSCPTANEELLERAFEAAASSEWATLAVKVLCHSSEGLLIPELAKRAVELRYIVWPNTKAIADMHRQLRQAVNRISVAPHVLHVGFNRYMLQAMRPDVKGVPRQPLPGRAGGSTSSSPAVAVGAAAPQSGGGSAFSAGAGAPVPFSLLGALPLESAAAGTQGGWQQYQPAAVASAGPDLGAHSSATADAGAGGGGAAGGGIGEEELTQEEESQQCRDCIEAAVHAGADRQRVQETLSKLKSRNLRIVFKVLCHAGAAGMRVSDIVKFARERRFVNWPDADRTSSIHGAIRTSKDMVVHVGTHQYALTLFPSVVPVPKPEQRRGARATGAGGAAAGPAGVTGTGEGTGGDSAEA